MRIGVITPWDTNDPRAWSGVIKPMVEALRSQGDVVAFSTHEIRDAVIDRAMARALGLAGRRYLVGGAVATSIKRARVLERELRRAPVDVLISIVASQDIAFLRSSTPIIQVVDATFGALKDFYPQYRGLSWVSNVQAAVLAARSAARTAHFLTASQWAGAALVRDHDIAAEHISSVPFGPAIAPLGAQGPRPDLERLKLLLVASDWDRKGGSDAVRVWAELRRRGAAVSLTVVGQTPPLPDGIKATGRVTHNELRDLYASHHVLLEPSRSNAGGVTLTDAAGFGLPAVAADTGGVASLVDNGVTGFLVAPGGISAMADRIQELQHESRWRSFSEASRQKATDQLNWQAWAQGAGAALRRVTAARNGKVKPRVLFFAPAIPYPGIEHAGGQYLRRLQDAVDPVTHATWLTHDKPSVRHAFNQRGVIRQVTLLGPQLGPRMTSAIEQLERSWARVDTQPMPLLPTVAAVLDPAVRRAMRQADVLDFQWSPWTKLARVMRLFNRDARIIFTFHDVMSQKAHRSLDKAPDLLRRTKWRLALLLARRWERRARKLADTIVVFSDKDRALLDPRGQHPNITVVHPPLADGEPSPHLANTDHRVLFVGFMARAENLEALRWFGDEIWPAVRARVPTATLHVAGAAMPEEVQRHYADSANGIELLGFVPDLGVEYRRASVVVVPLLHGAGVKFKTIEALLEGVPTVTTTIGAEGIGEHRLFTAVTDDAAQFAEAVVGALVHNQAAVERGRAAQEWAWQRYGVAAFETHIRRIYLAG